MDVTNADQARQLAEQAIINRNIVKYNSIKKDQPIEHAFGWEFPLDFHYPVESMSGGPHTVLVCRDGFIIFPGFFDTDIRALEPIILQQMEERRRKQHPE